MYLSEQYDRNFVTGKLELVVEIVGVTHYIPVGEHLCQLHSSNCENIRLNMHQRSHSRHRAMRGCTNSINTVGQISRFMSSVLRP